MNFMRISIITFHLMPIIYSSRHLCKFSSVSLLAVFVTFLGLQTVNARQELSRTFTVTVTKGQVAKVNRTIKVQEGDTVKLQWISDEPLILHLHGYDLTLKLIAGDPGAMVFKAHATGRYPVAIHRKNGHKKSGGHHGGGILYLEVHPR